MTILAGPGIHSAGIVDLGALAGAKRGRRIGVCIPARNEIATIGEILTVVSELREAGLVDDVLVIDDGSGDGTAARARAHGADVLPSVGGPGKGQALRRAVTSTDAELLVFLDADVVDFGGHFVTDLVAPLLTDAQVMLVKPRYRRALNGVADEGGRVSEVLARPLLRRFFPELATLAQPLAGECALHRSVLAGIELADGYGVEIALLIDVLRSHGRDAIAEVDLGTREHRNRPLHQLGQHADDILAAVFDRVGTDLRRSHDR
ncbi:MAG: glucosyl-3-phosphoglycerate synthase [Sporichthyaceae bacterium]